jgi:hypothetical protein
MPTRLTPEKLRERARSGAETALKQLRAEIIAIERTFPELALPKRRKAIQKSLTKATTRARDVGCYSKGSLGADEEALGRKAESEGQVTQLLILRSNLGSGSVQSVTDGAPGRLGSLRIQNRPPRRQDLYRRPPQTPTSLHLAKQLASRRAVHAPSESHVEHRRRRSVRGGPTSLLNHCGLIKGFAHCRRAGRTHGRPRLGGLLNYYERAQRRNAGWRYPRESSLLQPDSRSQNGR